MRYLVTGATAFAGCHLTKLLLQQGHEVWATSRRTNGSEIEVLDLLRSDEYERIHWVFCDLTNEQSCYDVFRGECFDGVFHLAAQSHPPTSFELPFYTADVNVQGSLNLLRAACDLQPKTHFMFCSTSEVYGAPDLKEGEKIAEDWPMRPINPYASSKAMFDMFLQERIANKKISGFITRAFSHTGPRRGKIFSISSDAYQIARILEGQQEPLIKVGNLESRRAVMDVRDCVRAYYLLMSARSSGVFNVGADSVFRIGDFLEMMLSLTGLQGKVRTEIEPAFYRPIDIPVQNPNTKKLKHAVDWQCAMPIDQTLSDLVAYWRKKVRAEGIVACQAA